MATLRGAEVWEYGRSPVAGVLSRSDIHLRACKSIQRTGRRLLTSSPGFNPGPRCHNPFPRRAASTRTVCVAAESLWSNETGDIRYSPKLLKSVSSTERQALLFAAPNFLKRFHACVRSDFDVLVPILGFEPRITNF